MKTFCAYKHILFIYYPKYSIYTYITYMYMEKPFVEVTFSLILPTINTKYTTSHKYIVFDKFCCIVFMYLYVNMYL